jgi:NAD(P)-dependent dehydrogenase (short-subunit alcohol dehydrogenase family)
MERRHATAAVIGAGDLIGGAIAKRFAAEGFTVFAGRRAKARSWRRSGARSRRLRRRTSLQKVTWKATQILRSRMNRTDCVLTYQWFRGVRNIGPVAV